MAELRFLLVAVRHREDEGSKAGREERVTGHGARYVVKGKDSFLWLLIAWVAEIICSFW